MPVGKDTKTVTGRGLREEKLGVQSGKGHKEKTSRHSERVKAKGQCHPKVQQIIALTSCLSFRELKVVARRKGKWGSSKLESKI